VTKVLTEVNVGDTARIVAINTKNGNVIRIMTLGIVEQVEIKVLSKTSGSVEIGFNNTSVGVSNDLAQEIMVV
jgi:Fe2+ transport system protein FeoA